MITGNMLIMFIIGFIIFCFYIGGLLYAIYWGHSTQREEMKKVTGVDLILMLKKSLIVM